MTEKSQVKIGTTDTAVVIPNYSECLLAYRRDGIVQISSTAMGRRLQLPNSIEIRMLADSVIDFNTSAALVSIESIRVLKICDKSAGKNEHDVIENRKVKSRIENFVSTNKNWTDLCCTGGILSTIVGVVCTDGEIDDGDDAPWCLYKEKLNIKPAGSSGFAPHLDSPSLRVTGLCDNFVTVMIAIDDMTIENGCLQVCKGNWNETNSVLCEVDCNVGINGVGSSNPDGNGRRGAIDSEAASKLEWEYIECVSGDVFIFSGWIPHRSACNTTQFPRRAVFLTYNHSEDGELAETYYRIMRDLRSSYLKEQQTLNV